MTAAEGIAAKRSRIGAGDDAPFGLLAAILAVQAEAPTLRKDRTVTVQTRNSGEYSYSYATLDSIKETIGPLLTKHNLVWTTRPSNKPDGTPILKYKLAWTPTGESIEDQVDLLMDPDHAHDIQALGSSITYTRRYAIQAVLDLVADTDDDGRGAGGGQSQQNETACPQCGKVGTIIKGKAEYGGGWLCFGKKGGCGAKFATDPALPPPEPDPVEKVKSLVRRHNVKAGELRTMLRGVGVVVPDDGNIVTFVESLRPEQARDLAEFIEGNPIPTGEPDVPSDASGFEHPPAEMTLEELVAPEVPS